MEKKQKKKNNKRKIYFGNRPKYPINKNINNIK